jgi:hypothetical protein
MDCSTSSTPSPRRSLRGKAPVHVPRYGSTWFVRPPKAKFLTPAQSQPQLCAEHFELDQISSKTLLIFGKSMQEVNGCPRRTGRSGHSARNRMSVNLALEMPRLEGGVRE